MLRNCLEEDVCLYRPNARWEGEFEWLKTLQNGQTSPTSAHVVWEDFNKKYSSSSKNKLQHIQLSDTTGISNGTGFYCQMKQKKNFLAAS